MFNKLIFRWRLKRILENKKINKRQRCLDLLQLLTGELISKQIFNSKLNLKINVLYPSINVYTRKLKEANFQIEHKSSISSDMLSGSTTVIVLDAFFTDENNYYVEVTPTFNSFKKECIRLLSLIAESDHAEYGYYEHVGRMLRTVLLNLEEVLIKIAVNLQD